MHSKKGQSLRQDPGAEICLIHVDISAKSEQYDPFTNLVLKQAKDLLKDALVRSAESHGGKLSSWKDDSGTFLFRNFGPDDCNHCCLAAIQMLDQLPSVKREVGLSEDLGRLIVMRILCDTYQVLRDREPHSLSEEFVKAFQNHSPSVSAGNQVTVTERVFRQLQEPLKSRFVKWKRSTELGIDYYASAHSSVRLGPALSAVSARSSPWPRSSP